MIASVREFEITHLVTLEETNLVGNVYFSNYFSWQGRCREEFLHRHAPDVLRELESGDLRMVTAHASCDFVDEFRAFAEIRIRMKLLALIPFGVSLGFEYSVIDHNGGAGEVLARGRQDIKFLRRRGRDWELSPVAPSLADVLRSASE